MLLSEFLDNFKSSNNEKPTHTSMKGGKWTIPSDQLSTLYQLINEQIILASCLDNICNFPSSISK